MSGHYLTSSHGKTQRGFTIVELLIVIIVIAILAAIVIVAFNGIQSRARDAKRLTDISTVYRELQLYYADNGAYPITTTASGSGLSHGLSDSNCAVGSKSAQWVPGLVPTYAPSLPQSFGPRSESTSGCYEYASDGQSYVLSAWRNVEGGPQSTTDYRRLGFHEGWAVGSGDIAYYCANATSESYWDSWYKYSYTFSNITTCNEN